MKKLSFIGLSFMLIFSGCNSKNTEIKRSEVSIDSVTHLWKFNKNGKEVTGTIISDTMIDHIYTCKLIVNEGVLQKELLYDGDKLFEENSYINGSSDKEFKQYHTNGSIKISAFYKDNLPEGEYKYYHSNGVVSFSTFYKKGKKEGFFYTYGEDGKMFKEGYYKNDLKHGIVKEYNSQGLQSKETIYEMGKKIKSYDFNSKGEKIIPITEKIELIEHVTGFYKSVNYNNDKILYEPIIIMKWKNISNKPFNEEVKIKGIFSVNGEEWSIENDYLQTSYGTPLQPGMIRQIYLQSSTGYVSPLGVGKEQCQCQLFINNQLYKTIKIKNKFLDSNRIN